ncbi:GNAT family N-acetyltransferase [Adlercreutzia sp. ZJ138]|uniref:GNAT family N-acetyltransferase n=1 Tax=Adlercreutzia sp. ZJ138 TaxID=2709405 RepID=UPI0013EDB1C1|nr:GNAT family N-acetyltransferase [Adlercreutzia sp. ZJ138]
MAIVYRAFREEDLPAICKIWNEVVEAGDAFPQTSPLDVDAAREFFGGQTLTQVADVNGVIFGMYILHPNNVGRCAHIANASYAVASPSRGLGLGRELVKDSLEQARKAGFRGLQFNAVVSSNVVAIHLYEDLGFVRVGTIPGGYVNGVGAYEPVYIFYRHCVEAPDAMHPVLMGASDVEQTAAPDVSDTSAAPHEPDVPSEASCAKGEAQQQEEASDNDSFEKADADESVTEGKKPKKESGKKKDSKGKKQKKEKKAKKEKKEKHSK